jgi:hypothetical protein
MPATVRIRELLPAPLEPTTATIALSGTLIDTSARAWASP